MSVHRLHPLPARADPSARACRSSASSRWSSLFLFWLWSPLGWLGAMATLWCVYFFRDPAARHAGARGPRGVAGGRPRQPHRQCGAADGTRARRTAAAARLDLHERVRLPREPQPGDRQDRAHRLSRTAPFSTPISTRRARTTSATRFVIEHRRAAASAWCRSPGWSRGASSASCARAPASASGERIGLIRFGSRVDVYLPDGVRPLVAEGQTAIAGETVIADLRAGDPQRTFRVG